MTTVNITYFGMDGTGRTLTEAKKDAGRKIEEAMSGSYQPRVLASRGIAMLLWRDPQGWRSSTLTDGGDDKGNDGFRDELSYSSGRQDYWEEYAGAIAHLAQQTWDGSEEYPPCLDNVRALSRKHECLGRRVLAEFASWRGFQLAYKVARAQGIAETDCHQWACHHAHEYASKVA